jgi:hypothetical protein
VKGKRVAAKNGAPLRISPPVGTDLALQKAAGPIAEAEGKSITVLELAVRLILIGICETMRCPACVAKMPCGRHGEGAFAKALIELGLAEPLPSEPADPSGEHQKLVEKWHTLWTGAFGKAPTVSIVAYARLKEARLTHGYELLAEAFEGVFGNDFYTSKAGGPRPNLLKVLNDPAMFAAMKRGAGTSGSLQAGPDAWKE